MLVKGAWSVDGRGNTPCVIAEHSFIEELNCTVKTLCCALMTKCNDIIKNSKRISDLQFHLNGWSFLYCI